MTYAPDDLVPYALVQVDHRLNPHVIIGVLLIEPLAGRVSFMRPAGEIAERRFDEAQVAMAYRDAETGYAAHAPLSPDRAGLLVAGLRCCVGRAHHAQDTHPPETVIRR